MANDVDLLKGRTILIVDDEKYTLRLVKALLVNMSARQVLEASSAEEAVLYLRDPLMDRVDAMIVDYNMPSINGLLMVKAIRCGAYGLPRALPVVMLTGHTDTALVRRAKSLDVNGFISKPVSKAALSATFQRVVADRFVPQAVEIYRQIDPKIGPNKPTAALARPSSAPAPRLLKIDDLEVGTTLARDLVIVEGMSILAGTTLNPRLIDVLRKLNAIEALEPVAVA